MQALWDFIANNDTVLLSLGILSAITFIASLVLIPYLIVRIPSDYFCRQQSHPNSVKQYVLFHWLVVLLKNLLGIVLIILGLLMLVLPGQGILTILVGVLLVNFPKKQQFERWLISRESVYKAVDWLRRRAGRESLKL